MLRWALVLALTVAAWAQPADVILRGAAIYTMDGARSWAQELAVGTGGRILYVGKDASAFQGPSTRVLDLRGKMVLPGFCDAHVHPLLGLAPLNASLDLTHVVQVIRDTRAVARAEARLQRPHLVEDAIEDAAILTQVVLTFGL